MSPSAISGLSQARAMFFFFFLYCVVVNSDLFSRKRPLEEFILQTNLGKHS